MKHRLLFLSTEFPPGPGGIGRFCFEIAGRLDAGKWAVTVVTPQDYAEQAAVESFNRAFPYRVETLSSGRAPLVETVKRTLRVLRCARRDHPEVILAIGESAVWLAMLAAARSDAAVIAVAVGVEFRGRGPIRGRLNRWGFSGSDVVICISGFTRDRMLAAGFRTKRCEVVPPGADPAVFRPLPADEALRFRQERLPAAQRLLVTVGNVSDRKGQELVIRSLPAVLAERPGTHYAMVGLPTRQAELAELARALGVEERVHFVGVVPPAELVSWLNAADLFVMTSRNTPDGDCEGFGIAAVEAALCGKPSVVAGSSGLAEAVLDGVTGMVVGEGDVPATAAAITSLLTNDARRLALGRAARERALRDQTWDVCAQRFDAIASELVEQARTREQRRWAP